MTPERALHIAAMYTAYAEGKQLQYRYINTNTLNKEWKDYIQDELGNPDIAGTNIEWRIKPEIKIYWVNVYGGLNNARSISSLYSSYDEAYYNRDEFNYVKTVQISWEE